MSSIICHSNFCWLASVFRKHIKEWYDHNRMKFQLSILSHFLPKDFVIVLQVAWNLLLIFLGMSRQIDMWYHILRIESGTLVIVFYFINHRFRSLVFLNVYVLPDNSQEEKNTFCKSKISFDTVVRERKTDKVW